MLGLADDALFVEAAMGITTPSALPSHVVDRLGLALNTEGHTDPAERLVMPGKYPPHMARP